MTSEEVEIIKPPPEFVEMFKELIKQQRIILEMYQKFLSPPMIVKSGRPK